MDKLSLIAAVGIPLAAFLFALYQWIVRSEQKRADEREKRWKDHLQQEERRHQQHEKRWEEHAKTFLRHEERIEKNERGVSDTRDEMHRDYVREDNLKEFRSEVRSYLSDMRDDVGKVFEKLGGMSRDLNQAIGELNARREE